MSKVKKRDSKFIIKSVVIIEKDIRKEMIIAVLACALKSTLKLTIII